MAKRRRKIHFLAKKTFLNFLKRFSCSTDPKLTVKIGVKKSLVEKLWGKIIFWWENVLFDVIFPPLKIFWKKCYSDFRVQHTPNHKETPSPSKSEWNKKVFKKSVFSVFWHFRRRSPPPRPFLIFIFLQFSCLPYAKP